MGFRHIMSDEDRKRIFDVFLNAIKEQKIYTLNEVTIISKNSNKTNCHLHSFITFDKVSKRPIKSYQFLIPT
jgi:hypothetical protein